MPPTLTPAKNRFHPYSVEEVIYSDSLTPKTASRYLAMLAPALKPNEAVDFIAEAGSALPPAAIYVAATNTHFYAGLSTRPTLSLPLAEVEFSSKRNLNSWSITPDTLVINHGSKKYKIERVPTPNHAFLQEFADRARLIDQVTPPQIFDQLATSREAAYPDTARPTPAPTTPAPHDMTAAIAQLKQLSELRDAGALTSEEFDQAKARLGF